MRICLYTTTALPRRGGQELVVDALARQFLVRGHDVVVLAPVWRDRHADTCLPYPVVRHPRFISTRHFVDWYRWFILRTHRCHGFDLLHCHAIYPAGYLGALCRRRLGVPLVITNHDGGVAANAGKIARPCVQDRHRLAISSADALVALSRLAIEGYQRWDVGHRHIETIPNGVDLDVFTRPVARPADLDPAVVPGEYILFLGRLQHRKGLDLLIKAFSQLSRARAGRLVIAGSGSQEVIVRAQVARLGLNDAVCFINWVTGDRKTYLLQNAVCTVIPSREPESFCLVALESYAAGRPIVASSVEGLCEHVIEGSTGLLFEADSAESLARALKQMLVDTENTNAMGIAGRRYARSFGWNEISEQHLSLYGFLLGQGGSSAAGISADMANRWRN